MYGFSWFPDTLTRLNLNDALFNMYHFLWVTALYLSPFYFAIWALFTYFLIRFNKPQILFISLLIYFLYVVELFDFVIFNWQVSIINTSFLQFNTLLVNNLNKIHPFIFYMGTFLVFNASFLSTSLQLKKTIFSPITKLNSLRTSLLLILIVSLTSLFLGSWWAVQEGTWGGWWNWDPSETFGLLFLMFTLLNFHTKFNLNLFYKIGIRNKALVYVLILTYFFIQLNFDLVSHNFGVKFFYFF
jgi:cytochrome c biogenesis factor